VSREEAPTLHGLIERVAALADLPVPRVALVDTDVSKRGELTDREYEQERERLRRF